MSHSRRRTMVRTLRSNSQLQKLHVQHIQQVNKILRVRLNNHTETKIDSFSQTEFLSLFGLHPIYRPSVLEGQIKKDIVYTRKNGSKSQITTTSFSCNNGLKTQSKPHKTLENDLNTERHVQKELLAKRKSLLNKLRDEVADQRKYDMLYEHDKQMNIILKITIKDLLKKMKFICNERLSS